MLPAGQGSWQMTALYGALFGLFAYATYDLTNYATLKGWTATLATSDIVWGMAMTAAVSTLGMLRGPRCDALGFPARRAGGGPVGLRRSVR